MQKVTPALWECNQTQHVTLISSCTNTDQYPRNTQSSTLDEHSHLTELHRDLSPTPQLCPPMLCQAHSPAATSPLCVQVMSFHMTLQKSQRQDNCTKGLPSSVFRRRISSPALPSPPNDLSPLMTQNNRN